MLHSSGLLAAGGMSPARNREPPLVLTGFFLMGLALSVVFPIAFSAAGDLAPGRAGAAISVVTTLGYGGFLRGPVLVGDLTKVASLRAALGAIAGAGFLIFVLSLRFKASQKDPVSRPPGRLRSGDFSRGRA